MKILHVADSHFQKKRLDECERCFDYIVEYAEKEKPDWIFHAGDLFEKNVLINSPEYLSAIESMMSLADIAPVIMVRGNHDPFYALNVFEKLDTKFPITYYDTMAIQKNSDFNLLLIPYMNPSAIAREDSIGDIHKSGADLIKSRINEFEKEHNPDKPALVLAHISILDSRFANSERIQEGEVMLSVDDLNLDWIDGVMLGHIHNSQQDIFEKTRIRYAGAHYRTRFDEILEPGFFMWTFDGKIGIDFVETPARDMIQIKLDEAQTKKLIAGEKLDVPPDSDVKIILEVPQGMTKMIDINNLNYETNSNVEVALRVNPITEVRSREIGKAVTDAGKLEEWAKVSDVEITSSIKKKLDEIINHGRGIYT